MTSPTFLRSIDVRCRGWMVASAVAFALSGCAVAPLEETAESASALAVERGGAGVGVTADERALSLEAWLAEPLTPARAVKITLLQSPRLRAQYATLGVARAGLLEAVRLPNPVFGYVSLEPSGGGPSQITRSVSLSLADLLLLPSRRSAAQAEYEHARLLMAGTILDAALATEEAWYVFAAADQVARMRERVAVAAGTSAALAERFYTAGNIPELQLARERAAAANARVAARRAAVEVARAKTSLNLAMGLDATHGARWTADTQLPPAVSAEDSADTLAALAEAGRLDVIAARGAVEAKQSIARATRGFRWLGDAEVGFERESELDGERLRGPAFGIEVPIFDQGQGRVAEAGAAVLAAQAELAQVELEAGHAVALARDGVSAARAVVDDYRDRLVPQRELVVRRAQERFNFMLIGSFELLDALEEKYDAYEGYVESLRDYWLARVELKRAVGGGLPSDGGTP